MPGRFTLAFATIFFAAVAAAQRAVTFEAASVKLLPPPISGRVMTGGGPGTSDPGRLTRSNVTLASILVEAFQIQGPLMAGPGWLSSERYEIIAVVPPGASRQDIPRMLQGLLAERFGLTFHRELRETSVYALVAGKNSPKLTPSANPPVPIPGRDGFPGLPGGVPPGVIRLDSAGSERRFAGGAMSLARLADYLGGQLDLPVIDLTRLPGNYDIVLYYSRQAPGGAHSSEVSPDLASAVREQLGLDLQDRKAPMEQLIIDHIERTPAPN